LVELEILDLGLRSHNIHYLRSGHEILRNLKNLKTLNLAKNCELNNASKDFLNELRALENLNLDEVMINSISAILNLPLLSNLNVSGFAGAKSELFIRPEVRIIPPKAYKLI
jgi:Mlc titration factor MtfA (ptsG expression regulator)